MPLQESIDVPRAIRHCQIGREHGIAALSFLNPQDQKRSLSGVDALRQRVAAAAIA